MVNLLPDDLSQLYQRIWSNIKPDYICQSSHLFQIHRAYRRSLDVLTMWLADHSDPLQLDCDIYSPGQQSLIGQTMKRRLNSRTRGLLEVSADGYVEFLHRSVRDWIDPIWPDILAKSGPDFDPNLCILKAFTAKSSYREFWIQFHPEFPLSFQIEVWESFGYALRVCDKPACASSLVVTLDQFDANFELISKEGEAKDSILPLYDANDISKGFLHWSSTDKALSLRWGYDANDISKGFLHWSSTDKALSLPWGPIVGAKNRHRETEKGQSFYRNSFIGLAAQFGVFTYVRDKVMANPTRCPSWQMRCLGLSFLYRPTPDYSRISKDG
ncbi:hypothetical protein F4777DRAFT_584378 [Nemania sp. FL0916]|nr:hypothetical protein F4777DRAFT_584378 [Nemania sp. FL0916]